MLDYHPTTTVSWFLPSGGNQSLLSQHQAGGVLSETRVDSDRLQSIGSAGQPFVSTVSICIVRPQKKIRKNGTKFKAVLK